MVFLASRLVWTFALFFLAAFAGAWSFYAWQRSTPGTSPPWLAGFALLLWLNFKHYLWALWGVRLRLDPDYPCETRFRGDLVVDSVLEYRGYGLFVPWCAFLAIVMPVPLLLWFSLFWTTQAFLRADFYSTPFKFWTRAYNEAPGKHRNRIRYFEEISLEIERRLKAGADWESPEMQELNQAGRRVQDCIVERKK